MREVPIEKVDLKCRQACSSFNHLVNSLIHDTFKQFVDEKVAESNNKIDNIKGNKFSVLPTMAKIFADTKFESSTLLA